MRQLLLRVLVLGLGGLTLAGCGADGAPIAPGKSAPSGLFQDL